MEMPCVSVCCWERSHFPLLLFDTAGYIRDPKAGDAFFSAFSASVFSECGRLF
jgi:hypothetical protein